MLTHNPSHIPPYVGFLLAELVVGTAIIVGWNLWDRRTQIRRWFADWT